jgi:hypothetical protein
MNSTEEKRDIIQTQILYDFLLGHTTNVRAALKVLTPGELSSLHMDLIALAEVVRYEHWDRRGVMMAGGR